MALPRLSVVVPNYNHGGHLRACLQALLDQSVPPDEILVIDDASTDDSMEVLAGFARTQPSIRIIRNEQNQGVVAGMNRGIELAAGKYCLFAAADDLVLPGLFERSLRLLAEHPQAALSCTISEWRDADADLRWPMGAGMANDAGYLSPDTLVELGLRGKLFIASHCSIFRKQALVDIGGFVPDLRWHCDWYACYGTAFRHGLCYVPETLSLVNLHPRSYYGSGRSGPDHRKVLLKLLELMTARAMRDVAGRVRDSGALGQFGVPMLRAVATHPAYRQFLSWRLLHRSVWRSLQVTGRRHFPPWLARLCLRMLYSAPPRARHADGPPR
jgi:glycosyltransferase involved in cell wall biosynthesis